MIFDRKYDIQSTDAEHSMIQQQEDKKVASKADKGEELKNADASKLILL